VEERSTENTGNLDQAADRSAVARGVPEDFGDLDLT